MTKVKDDLSRVRLEVDGKQAINQLGKLEMEAKQLAIDLKLAKKGTQEYIDTSKRLKDTTAQIKGMRTELGLSGQTMTQLTRYQRELRKEITNTATSGTAEYKKLKKEYQAVTNEITKQRKELNGTAGFFGDIKKELKSFAVLAVGALGVTELFAGIQNLISGSAELADSISDVQKTTELTDSQIKDLMLRFKGFNTRTPRAELLALADEAGKMGIRGVNSISQYVEETNELTTALGDLGDDAGLRVAKMADRFDVSMRQIGSGINAVADNTKAKAGFITEFLSRLAGTGNEVGIAAGDILGYGAAIDEMGLNVEMSSTALNGFLIEFTKNTEKYGKAAGYAEGELTKLVGEQGTNEGFLAFLERLREANPVAKDFLQRLEDLGIDGARGSQVFLALSQNVAQLRDRQALANREIEKGTSLTEEYNKKNENFAGNLERIQKWFAGFFVNGGVMNALNSFVGKWSEWINIPVSQKMEDERISLNKLHAQILTTNIGSEDRTRLIKELQTLYPNYLGNLNAETVSNDVLGVAIRKVNDQLVNKIILQKQDEVIEKQNAQIAEKKMKLFEQEDKVREKMIKTSEKYGITIKAANSLEAQAMQVLDEARTIQARTTQTRGRLFDSVSDYSHELSVMIDIQAEANGLDLSANKLLEDKNKLIERLGIKTTELTQAQIDGRAAFLGPAGDIPPIPPGGGGTDPIIPVDPKAVTEAKKLLDQQLEQYQSYLQRISDLKRDYELADNGAHESEILKVEYQYQKLEDELKQHLANKTISQTEYDAQLQVLQELEFEEHSLINAKYADQAVNERKDAERKILEATGEEKDLAVLKTHEHYDELLSLAERFGLDTLSIEEARRRALATIQKTHDQKEIQEATQIAEAKQMIAQGLSASIGAVIDFIGNRQGELTAFQKILTVAGIAIDSAAALGKIVPLAVEAAAGTGPAAPFVLAGYIATMAGTVFGAVAKAKNALTQSNVPAFQSESTGKGDRQPSRGRGGAPAVKKTFFYGGYTGDEGLGEGDRFGEFAGAVHKREYVVPTLTMSDPYVANLMPAIEQIRQDNIRGFNSHGGKSGMDTAKMEALMMEMISAYRASTGKRVVLVNSDLEEFQDERIMLRDRYTAN